MNVKHDYSHANTGDEQFTGGRGSISTTNTTAGSSIITSRHAMSTSNSRISY